MVMKLLFSHPLPEADYSMIPVNIETKINIEIRPQPFDPWAELPLFQQQLAPGQYGATAVFIGTLRDFNQGDNITALWMEHYPGMTDRYLQQLVKLPRVTSKTTIEDAVVESLSYPRLSILRQRRSIL